MAGAILIASSVRYANEEELKMCSVSPYFEIIFAAIIGGVIGYGVYFLQQRFTAINSFSSLIENEIREVSSKPDNVGGDFGIDKWHFNSRRRVKAYFKLVEGTRYFNKKKLREAVSNYCATDINYAKVQREGLLDLLCEIYKQSRKMA